MTWVDSSGESLRFGDTVITENRNGWNFPYEFEGKSGKFFIVARGQPPFRTAIEVDWCIKLNQPLDYQI